MKLKRILLSRAPGIDEPFTLDDLSPKINLIVGPNGSGKTTLCRALTATLWPSQDGSTRLDVDTVWKNDGHTLNAERHNRAVSWRNDGRLSAAPSLPDAHLASCYKLGVRDLMQEDNKSDLNIAREIRVQMAGGYDLQSIIAQSFSTKQKTGAKERRELIELRNKLKHVESHFSSLAGDEDRLIALDTELGEARSAEYELRLLESAIELAEHRSALADFGKQLSDYSTDLDNFIGDESAQIRQLDQSLSDCDTAIELDATALQETKLAIEAANLTSRQVQATDIQAWIRRIELLAEQERKLSEARNKEEQYKAEFAAASKQLNGDSAATLDLSDEAIAMATDFVRERDELSARGSALAAQYKLLDAPPPAESRDKLMRAASFLRDWLSTPQSTETKLPASLVMSATFFVVIGGAPAYFHTPLWLALSALGGGLLTATLLMYLGKSKDDLRSVYQNKFEQCYEQAPEEWSVDAVTQHLSELEKSIAHAALAEEQRAQLAPIKIQQDELKLAETELNNKQSELQRQTGTEISSALGLADLLNRYQAYRSTSLALSGAKESATNIAAAYAKRSKEACDFLAPYDYKTQQDATGLSTQLLDLKERLTSHTGATKLHATTNSRLNGAKIRRQHIETQIDNFYDARGLKTNDKDKLNTMLERLPAYKVLKDKLGQHKHSIAILELKLSDRPDLPNLTEDGARQLHDDTRLKAERVADISAEIGGIQARIKEAREGKELELAQAQVARGEDDLSHVCEAAQLQTAGRFLLEQIDREHEQLSRPPVMERAADYFRSFTRNAYELELPDIDNPEFTARDTSAARSLSLAELSDGTRIQLLLAVRIAFAIEAERGTKVPLILDEALSTADPERFRAVAESLVILAEHRQIFYLSANPGDVSAWKSVLAGADEADLRVIDLGVLRGAQAAISDASMLYIPPPPALPDPGVMSAEQYGLALGVPPANPLRAFEALHLFYLLRDNLDTLHTLLRDTRITTLGQWLSLVDSKRADSFLPSDVCQRLSALCGYAQQVYALRSIGRGKLVDGEVLRASKAVSSTFIERLTSLASDLGGDSKRLLAAFEDRDEPRVKRFNSTALEALRTYLEDEAYIDARPILSNDEIRLQVIGDMQDTKDGAPITRQQCGLFVDQLLAALSNTIKPAE